MAAGITAEQALQSAGSAPLLRPLHDVSKQPSEELHKSE